MEKINEQSVINIQKPTITLKAKAKANTEKIQEEDKIKFNLKIENDDYGLKILTPIYGSDKIVISNNIRKYMGGVSQQNGKWRCKIEISDKSPITIMSNFTLIQIFEKEINALHFQKFICLSHSLLRNLMIDKGTYIEMHLSNRGIVKFDKEDFDKIDKHLWFATQTNGGIYARRKWTEEDTTRFKATRETFALHSEIMDFLPGKDESGESYSIDHIDRDTLNNRRGNLRKASAKLQAENRDRKPGVTKQKNITIEANKPCYRLRITVDKKRKNAYFYYSDYGGMPGALAEAVRCRDIIIEKLKDKSISKEVSEGKKTLKDLID